MNKKENSMGYFVDGPDNLSSIDWKNLSIDNVSEDLYFTRYFLETKDHFDHSLQWLHWLDLDSLEMLQELFRKTCKEDIEIDDDVCDFFCLTLSMFNWQNKNHDMNLSEENIIEIVNLFGGAATLALLVREGKAEIIESGDGNVFGDEIIYNKKVQ